MQNHDKYVFSPYGQFKLVWDPIVTLLVLYFVIIIPVRVAFEPRVTLGAAVIDYLILAIFALDILVSFNTAYVDPQTEAIVTDRHQIALQYVRFWFWVDLLAAFPFSLVATTLSNSSQNFTALRTLRILRLCSILKLFRMNRLKDIMGRLRINPHFVSLAVLVLNIFFVAHIYGCVWHFIALYEEDRGGVRSWVDILGFAQTDIYDRYVASVYYVMVTMMTVGFGDIRAVTNTERVFAIVTMLTGGVVFGAMISRLAVIIQQRNPEAKALERNMTELKSFLVDIRMPTEARKRVIVSATLKLPCRQC
jgi:hypothetical protein